MPDDVLIKITTAADLGGALAASTALEKQIAQAKLLNTEYAEEEARLISLRKAIHDHHAELEATATKAPGASVDPLQPAPTGGGGNAVDAVVRKQFAEKKKLRVEDQKLEEEGAKKSLDWIHSLKGALKGLGREIPGLGFLSGILSSPIALGATALTVGIGAAVAEVKRLNAELKEFQALGDVFRSGGLAPSLKGLREDLQAARVESAIWHDQLKRVAGAFADVNSRAAEANKLLAVQAAALATVGEAQDSLLKSALAIAKSRGLINDDEIDHLNRILALHKQITAAQDSAGAEANAIAEKQAALAAATGELPKLIADRDALADKQTKDKQRSTAIAEKLAEAEAATTVKLVKGQLVISPQEQALDDQLAILQGSKDKKARFPALVGTTKTERDAILDEEFHLRASGLSGKRSNEDVAEFEKMQAEFETNRQKLGAYRKAIPGLRADQEETDKRIGVRATDLGEFDARIGARKQQRDTLPGEIASDTATFAANDAGRSRSVGLGRRQFGLEESMAALNQLKDGADEATTARVNSQLLALTNEVISMMFSERRVNKTTADRVTALQKRVATQRPYSD
jgi:hypothetical protein